MNIQVLSNHLQLDGYEIVIARDGEEVLSLINHEERLDLVILDLMMPKLSGYEVCSRIRMDYSLTELPVLILTARSQLKDVVTAFQAGANDYLIKPYMKEELLARVGTLFTLKKVMAEVLELNLQLEERVQKRTAELNDSTNKLLRMEQSRRHLLSNISHDLGTPMTSIQGYVKAMLDGVVVPGNTKYLQIIYEKTLFIDRLIQDLHDLSRLESGQTSFYKKEMEIQQILPFLYGFEEEVSNRGITYNVRNNIPEDELQLSVYIDIDRLRQVITNLVTNAMKYTEENGVITVEITRFEDFYKKCKTRQEHLQEIAATLEERMDKEPTVVIGVHDNGKGIDSKSLPHLFERFYRADSEQYDTYRNAGLGLAIAKEIIEQHQGVIWVESTKSQGSSFYFTLPFVKGGR